jgi:hypothetical protein
MSHRSAPDEERSSVTVTGRILRARHRIVGRF